MSDGLEDGLQLLVVGDPLLLSWEKGSGKESQRLKFSVELLL